MDNKKSTITLEELLTSASNQTKNFIKELGKEDEFEKIEHLDSIINDIKAQKEQTKIQRNKFVNQIKSGLGEKIKNNPNKIIIHKKPWYVKFKNWIKKIFTSF